MKPARTGVPVFLFAVREEAAFVDRSRTSVVLTGMGAQNASDAARRILEERRPSRVFTCGFAGGLNPEWKRNQLVYELASLDAPLESLLKRRQAVSVRFVHSDRVLITPEEKKQLWDSTGADAVEMESSAIRNRCEEQGVRCDTVRIISDAREESLPLDFNSLMTQSYRMRWGKLIWNLAVRPARIASLIQFQSRLREASRKLGGLVNDISRAE